MFTEFLGFDGCPGLRWGHTVERLPLLLVIRRLLARLCRPAPEIVAGIVASLRARRAP
jgi:hypothetical protein